MPQLPISIKEHVEKHLACKVTGFRPSSGGCINFGGELVTNKGSYFLKWNDRLRYPQMFEKESLGLKLLQATNCIDITEVIQVGEIGEHQFILMAYIRAGRRAQPYWSVMGEQLANLHRNTHSHFGLDYNNYIGSLVQKNSLKENWVDFFIEERLAVQLSLDEENNKISLQLRKQFEVLYKKLPDLLPQEKPALLHGDLWSGNVMVNALGEPTLIDPAVYYGNREAELAFTLLFGGFNSQFYSAYQKAFPLSPGFDSRTDLYNLYPLLVHVNLFGESYVLHVRETLKRFL